VTKFILNLSVLAVCALAGCQKKAEPVPPPADASELARLKPTKDPVLEEINAFRQQTRQKYNTRQFAELEKLATELRQTKPVFGNGSWKIVQFYDSFECSGKELENMWQLHDRIHQDWIAQFPQSVTAQIAYAAFFKDYGWHARGHAYADKVTTDGARLFDDRLQSAFGMLEPAGKSPEKDQYWYLTAFQIALGQGWTKYRYEQLLEEAKKFEPKFWGYDVARAHSLLPRWYGEPGDWEEYAEHAAARPDGLGAEVYARIVMAEHGYYDNVFRETKASWPKVREGLLALRQKYDHSFEILNLTAKLAALAGDRALAKETFDKLGDTYLAVDWKKPDVFLRSRKWAETGSP
jgi:hypothetical protein